VLRALLCAVAIVALAGCAPDAPPLRVATHPWPGYDLLRLADRSGLLDHERAELLTTGATESLAALAEDRADAATLTLDEVLRSNRAGMSLQVVLVIDISRGADALVARPPIDSLEALRGRRIGVETSAVGELMLRAALQEAGLRRDEVVVEPVPGRHIDAWRDGQLDAMVTYEPTLSILESEGNLTLFDSRRIPHSIVDVLAVRADAARLRPRRTREVVEAYLRGHRLLRDNPMETHYALAAMNGLEPEVTAQAFRRLLLPALDQNRHLLGGDMREMLASCRELSAVLGGDGPAAQGAECEGLFTAGFLPGESP
jgi:NitT/TauT family transport system substrate-binding protein